MGVFPIAKDVHIYPWILKVCKYVTWQWGTMVVVGFKVLIIASQFFFKSGMNSALSRWVTHDHKNSYKWQTHWKGKAYRIAFTQGHTNNKQQSRSFCYQLWIFVLIPWISPDTCLHSFTFDYVLLQSHVQAICNLPEPPVMFYNIQRRDFHSKSREYKAKRKVECVRRGHQRHLRSSCRTQGHFVFQSRIWIPHF